MPDELADWLIEHFRRFNACDDPQFMHRYLRRLRVESRRRLWTEVGLLEWVQGEATGSATNPTVVDLVTRSWRSTAGATAARRFGPARRHVVTVPARPAALPPRPAAR